MLTRTKCLRLFISALVCGSFSAQVNAESCNLCGGSIQDGLMTGTHSFLKTLRGDVETPCAGEETGDLYGCFKAQSTSNTTAVGLYGSTNFDDLPICAQAEILAGWAFKVPPYKPPYESGTPQVWNVQTSKNTDVTTALKAWKAQSPAGSTENPFYKLAESYAKQCETDFCTELKKNSPDRIGLLKTMQAKYAPTFSFQQPTPPPQCADEVKLLQSSAP